MQRSASSPGGNVSALLTLREASERLRLSPWALSRAIKRGELEASKPAGRIRISEAAIDDWLKLTRVEPEVRSEGLAESVRASVPSGTRANAFRARLKAHVQ